MDNGRIAGNSYPGDIEIEIILKGSKIHSVGILGTGESGMGAVRLAKQRSLDVFVSDFNTIVDSSKDELISLNVSFEEGQHSVDRLSRLDQIVKSPGIPDTAAIVVKLREANVPVISEIEFAYQFSNAKIIGITGSNGKTTTTLLTEHLLKTADLDVVAGGNLGRSFAQIVADGEPDIAVLELSSFQLDGIDTFKPDVAVLLNITPDHLDRYEYSMDKYADSKLRLIKNMKADDVFIYNQDDQIITAKEQLKHSQAHKLEITTTTKTGDGAYWLENHLIFDCEKGIHILPQEELPLVGRHNLYNQMAAILAAIQLDVPFSDILSGLRSFVNAPHRLERIAVIDGVHFINDSKATNVDAVYYALEAMDQPIIWIAGGINKGNDYTQIKSLVNQKVKSLICLGLDNKHLTQEFSSDTEEIKEVDSAEKAVRAAFDSANQGDVVLLSPACSSFDLFDNYEQRGDMFREAVLKLKKEIVKA